MQISTTPQWTDRITNLGHSANLKQPVNLKKLDASIIQLGEISSSSRRLMIGLPGLFTRTLIDYTNPDVSEETQQYSAIKTAVKVSITLFNGVLTRYVAEGVGLMLARKGIIKPVSSGMDQEAFIKGVATAVSFLATILTTFTLDIPLINFGLNGALGYIFPNGQPAHQKPNTQSSTKTVNVSYHLNSTESNSTYAAMA